MAKRSRSPNGTRKLDSLYPIRNVPDSIKALMSVYAHERGMTVGEFLTFLVTEFRKSRDIKPLSDSDRAFMDFMNRTGESSPASRDEGNDPGRN